MKKVFLIMLYMVFHHAGATHIVGGEITYERKSGDTFTIILKLYIDCFNGNTSAISQDSLANFTVFDADSGFVLINLCQSVRRNLPVRVSKTNLGSPGTELEFAL